MSPRAVAVWLDGWLTVIQELLLAVDEYLVKKDYRLQALSLLSSFVRLQPPHLHLVLQTPMIHHLLNSLLIDTSATVVDLALTVLVMFIPHITSCLVSILPKLLLTYARVLCWDQYYRKIGEMADPAEAQEPNQQSENGSSVLGIDESWEQLQCSVDTVDAIAPQANYLFTFLYGLFPLNFMNFVRKPRRYLKMKSYPRADDLDLRQGLIRTRTEEHRRVHLLHPSFFTTTPEDELIDNRWLKTDPADLVTECMGLCIAVSHTLNDPGPPPTAKLPEIPKPPGQKNGTKNEALLSSDEETTVATPSGDAKSTSWRNTQSTTITIPTSPFNVEPGRLPVRESSGASLRDMASHSRNNSPEKSEPNERPATAGQSSPTRQSSRPSSSEKHLHSLQGFAQTVSLSPYPHSALPIGNANNTAALQREIMLLKNDLNFERYLKQQHLAHIGNLQRKSVSEATVASETENLLNTNRNLKAKLIKANDLYTQLKKETMTSRSQAKKYEEQLSSKLKAYREEEKRWQMEASQLHHELEKAQNECEHLKNLIVESELREQHTRNNLIALQRDLEDMDTLRAQLRDAEAKLQKYELRDLDFQRTREDHERFRNELETVKLELQARDVERDRTKKAYDYKIAVLEARLRSAQVPQPGQLPASVQQMIDSALAGTNAKLAQLRKSHAKLLQKYADLELRNLELEAPSEQRTMTAPGTSAGNPARANSVLSLTRYADDATGPAASLGSAVARRNSHRAAAAGRKPHAFSDPSFFEENLLPENDDVVATQKPLSANAISLSLDRDRERLPMRLESLADIKPGVQEQGDSVGILPIHGLEDQELKAQHDFAPRPTESLPSSRSGFGGEGGGGLSGKPLSSSQVRVYGRGMW